MSLLDDVSIVVTPNGYKAGELYAVIPVPTEGSEKILNTDFATDSNWTPLGGWSISGGSANCNGGSIMYTNASIIATKIYKITYTVSGFVSGGVKVRINGSPDVDGLTRTSNGTFTEYITSSSSPNGNFSFAAVVSFVGSIDNVSVKEYTAADMDVTRATAATRVDENGLVNYAEVVSDTDIVTNGDFSNGSTDWTLQNGWALGSNDVVFTPSASSYRKLFQVNFLTIGKVYKLSFEIKSISAGSIANFEPNSPSFNTVGVKTQTYVATFDDLYLEPTNDANLTIDNISVKEVTRDNVPRIDYTGGGCPHILAEPMRTNNLTASQDLTNSFWNITRVETVVASTVLSPDGTTFGFKAIPNSENNTHYVDYDYGFLSMPSGAELTYSIFVKPFGYTNFQLATSTSFALKYQNFELTGGGVVGTGDVNGAKIEKIGEWYRCSITETLLGTTPRVLNIALPSSGLGRNPSFVGNSTDGVLLWGGQIEEGAYGTSYIPNLSTTSGSTVTRNQDIFTRDGIGSLINSTEGVLFVEMAALTSIVTVNNWLTISDGTANNQVAVGFETNAKTTALIKVGGSTAGFITFSGDYSQNKKIAFKWKENDFALWIDGVEVGVDTSGATLSSGTLNSLQFNWGAGGNYTNAKVKQLQVYKTALTDEQLLQLTGESGTDFYESYAEMASALTYTIQ